MILKCEVTNHELPEIVENEPVPVEKRPSFNALWNHYPPYEDDGIHVGLNGRIDHAAYGSMGVLYKHLGGLPEHNLTYGPDAQGRYGPFDANHGNTCASRMSVAFNEAGYPIDIPSIWHDGKVNSLSTKFKFERPPKEKLAFAAKSKDISYCTPKSQADCAPQLQRIIYRVSEFIHYLNKIYGKPDLRYKSCTARRHWGYTSDYTKKRSQNGITRRAKGIVVFLVTFESASGHVALWNGYRYRIPKHDDYENYHVLSQDGKTHIDTYGSLFWELPD